VHRKSAFGCEVTKEYLGQITRLTLVYALVPNSHCS